MPTRGILVPAGGGHAWGDRLSPKTPFQLAHARLQGSRLTIEFDGSVRGVAPGQAAVCYTGDLVVGGGVVEEAR